MGCGGCLIVVALIIAGVWFIRRTPDAPAPNIPPLRPAPITEPKSTTTKPPDNTIPAPASGEMTAKRLHAVLANARNLIKAKVYPPAREKLKQIIDEAPGTSEADEAKTLLDSIPK
jgi:hypothetical protein